MRGILRRLLSRRRQVKPSLTTTPWIFCPSSHNLATNITTSCVVQQHNFSSNSQINKVGVKEEDEDGIKDRRRRGVVPNDGLTLSHFIKASAAAATTSSPSVQITRTNNQTTTISIDGGSCSSIPRAVELGDEFDEIDDDELDLMITGAMSSSRSSSSKNVPSSPTNTNTHNAALVNRLGYQIINNNEEDEYNSKNNNNNNTQDGNIDNENFHTLKFHLKTYGCQMNVNDTDIVRSILVNNHIHQHQNNSHDDNNSSSDNDTAVGVDSSSKEATTLSSSNNNNDVPLLRFIETNDEIQADVLLTNTCAIRDNAEQKVWHRLRELRSHDRNYPLSSSTSSSSSSFVNNTNEEDANAEESLTKLTKEQRKQHQRQQQQQKNTNKNNKKKRIIGVLGCMAERLKEDMFQHGTADVVVGPDAYRDLPRLISVLVSPSVNPTINNNDTIDTATTKKKGGGPTIPTERAVNVQLSLDETYASITPIRSNPNDVSAFVSIMRGCNNMCSYCVVPFTRGRERSRDMESIIDETKRLVDEEDIKEVILLGQNVNSYHDVSNVTRKDRRKKKKMSMIGGSNEEDGTTYQTSNDGFSNMFRLRGGDGYRFADLLESISDISPELRVRFTSPHPKDYRK